MNKSLLSDIVVSQVLFNTPSYVILLQLRLLTSIKTESRNPKEFKKSFVTHKFIYFCSRRFCCTYLLFCFLRWNCNRLGLNFMTPSSWFACVCLAVSFIGVKDKSGHMSTFYVYINYADSFLKCAVKFCLIFWNVIEIIFLKNA